jgi:outer membrane protein insertion porin family
VAVGLAILFSVSSAAQAQIEVRLDRVVITGNQRVEEEAIRVQLRSRADALLDADNVDSDIRALYGMGFFDNIDADLSSVDGEWVLTYRVDERPFIRDVRIEGNEKIDREDLDKDLKVRPNTIFDPLKVRRGIEDAKKSYEKLGYLDAIIEATPEDIGENEIILVYAVEEKDIVRIDELVFEGARAFTGSQLKRLMQTKESWFLSFITGAGNLDHEVLETDLERLTAFYYDNGYIDVRIDEPDVQRDEKGLRITVKIDEGDEYRVGDVSIGGDELTDMDAVRALLALIPEEIFRTSKLRADINTLTEVYGDQGYAFVNVAPDTRVDAEEKVVHVTYTISKGPEVFIDKIQISGNSKTRDKVIRRELRVQEQQRFSGSRLRNSQERLQRLGFFEDVNITTRKSDVEDRLDLIVDVKEASTGTFSAGAGISSGETFLFNLRLSEINLFGRGQRLVLSADFGSIRRNLSIDFTEPYFRDTQLTLGASAFNWELEFDDFTRGGTGATVRFLYPLTALGWASLANFSLEDTRLGLEYRIEDAEISDVSSSAATSIRAEQGTSLTSSLTPRLLRDTRNHPFDPTAGSLQDLSIEVAGLGGESRFLKAEARLRWYIPFWQSESLGTFTFASGTTFGWGLGFGDRRELPLFERYFPGGINSIRGFEILSLGPQNLVTDAFGRVLARDSIGGSRQLIFNHEIIFPIVQSLGLKGVIFFDAGNAFTAAQGIDFDEMRLSAGAGVRWLSPMGPLRIELGFPVRKFEGDEEQPVNFSFGAPP